MLSCNGRSLLGNWAKEGKDVKASFSSTCENSTRFKCDDCNPMYGLNELNRMSHNPPSVSVILSKCKFM